MVNGQWLMADEWIAAEAHRNDGTEQDVARGNLRRRRSRLASQFFMNG